jgi:hypothetical protein
MSLFTCFLANGVICIQLHKIISSTFSVSPSATVATRRPTYIVPLLGNRFIHQTVIGNASLVTSVYCSTYMERVGCRIHIQKRIVGNAVSICIDMNVTGQSCK